MTFKLPNYIPVEYARAPADYSWSEWDPYDEFGDSDPATEATLSGLSDRAISAYCIGCSEWVVARLQAFHEDARSFSYLEALWVFETTDDRIWLPEELDQEEWQGKVLGAMGLSLMTVLNSVYGVEDDTSASDGALAELLPMHVLPNQDAFLSWRCDVLKRLAVLYPRKGKAWGDPVPREVLDPGIPLAQIDAQVAIQRFLATVDLQNNPYIRLV